MQRYDRVAIWLHWLITGFIVALVPMGLLMEDTPKAMQVSVYQLHKSFGLMVLFLSLARISWRLMNPPPPLPKTIPLWERAAANTMHTVFYVLIIAIPLSGWMLVSASPKNIPTVFLMLFHWPHIGVLAQMAIEQKKAVIDPLKEVHEILALGTIGLMVLHIGAALKHQYLTKDDEMARMIPSMGTTTPPSRQARGGVMVFGGTALLFVLIALFGNTAGNTAPTPADHALADGPGNWIVDQKNSTLGFTFTHVGNTIKGDFTRWNATIQFDPDDLQNAHIRTRVDLGSAVTGDATYDAALPEADWFDLQSAREAVFESQKVREDGTGGYVIDGTLNLHGFTLPLALPFTLVIDGDQAQATGSTALDRLAFGLGLETDGKAEYVQRGVKIFFSIKATRNISP